MLKKLIFKTFLGTKQVIAHCLVVILVFLSVPPLLLLGTLSLFNFSEFDKAFSKFMNQEGEV